jgi:hypothetical protein
MRLTWRYHGSPAEEPFAAKPAVGIPPKLAIPLAIPKAVNRRLVVCIIQYFPMFGALWGQQPRKIQHFGAAQFHHAG